MLTNCSLITGRVSMSAYLFHVPLFHYINHQLELNNEAVGPGYGLNFCFSIFAAVIVGAFFTKFVEEPARNMLKTNSNLV